MSKLFDLSLLTESVLCVSVSVSMSYLFNTKISCLASLSVNEIAHAPIIVGDPSYFPQNKTQDPGCGTCGAVDLICILDHPIEGTENSESLQIIIPARCVYMGCVYMCVCI